MPPIAKNLNPWINDAREACHDETRAVEFWERHRGWDDCAGCVHCGSVDVYKMQAAAGGRDSRFRWRCRDCGKQYTVRIGTIMEDSKIPVRHWTLAVWMYCASKKGFAAKQFQRMTGLSYKSSLFLAHRIRFAMSDEPETPLIGTVEVDETYIGGKPRKLSKQAKEKLIAEGKPIPKNKRGAGTKKIPVVALVERGGRVVASPVQTVTGKLVKDAIRAYVHPYSRIMTDELHVYVGIGKDFAYGHRTTRHKDGEYARLDEDGIVTHSNSAEGFFALLKRGIVGIYHSVSPRHLHRYVNEAAWRYSHRHIDDGHRMAALIRCAEGKRLPNRHSAAL
jgi:transposase-like protein